MPTRRIIVVSADDEVGARLATALQGVGDQVDVQTSIDSLESIDPPELCVIYFGGALARPFPSHLACRVIAVLPRGNLADVVDLMQASDRISGAVFADGLEGSQLAAIATRIISGELFGLDKIMTSGTKLHSQVVGDVHAKASCMAQVSAFAAERGVPRKHDEAIEQCMDEMLMNALYDAPVDDRGDAVFAGMPVKTRITRRVAQDVVVQYACDELRLAVSVRDAFGTLERATVLRYLHKCLHADHKVDRKVGGAGVGLYLMVNSATTVSFNVVPGVAAEVICTFACATPKLQLQQFGFFVEAKDVTGALTATARPAPGSVIVVEAPRARAARRKRIFALACVGALAVAGAAAWPRIFGPGKPAPIVEIDSTPSSAAVEIDGKPMGDTPLRLTSLGPDSDVSIVFRQRGYRDQARRLHVPDRGGVQQLVQPLETSDAFVRVRFVSTPAGARIVQAGQPAGISRTYTPAEVFVEANKVQRFTLTMRNHVPAVIEPFVAARGAGPLDKAATLEGGATLRIEATIAGKATVVGAPDCAGVTLPFGCVLAPGTYTVEYAGPHEARIIHRVELTGDDAVDRFELGLVEAAPGKLLPGGAKTAVLEAGLHTLVVSEGAGTHTTTVRVTVGASVIAN